MHWLSQWLPEVASSYGADIDAMFGLIYWITAVTFLLVMTLLVLFLVAYRGRPGRKAVYSHGNNALELAWTLTPAVILIWLAFHSQTLWDHIRGKMPEGDIHVGVSGKQYNWFFYYPGKDGKLGAASNNGRFDGGADRDGKDVSDGKDNLEASSLDVPVNKVIRISLTSQDVIHSLFLPNMRLKQDAVPGRTVEIWFKPTKPGKYDIACAELCGFGHYTMASTLVVHDEASWAQWLKEHPQAFPAESMKVASHE